MLCRDNIKGFTWKPQSPLTLRENAIEYWLVVPLWEHRAASRRYGERHKRCPALNHMCNQSKLTARRQVRVTS